MPRIWLQKYSGGWKVS